jgi:hypothetical protein
VCSSDLFKPWIEVALTSALPFHHDGIPEQQYEDARTHFFFRVTAKF